MYLMIGYLLMFLWFQGQIDILGVQLLRGRSFHFPSGELGEETELVNGQTVS